jgi:hypothetical protein
MIDTTERIALFVIILAVTLLLSFVWAEGQKSRIREALTEAGCEEISISWRLLEFDQGNNVFDVTYLDSHGHERRTVCKMSSRFLFGSSEIYWKDSPQ